MQHARFKPHAMERTYSPLSQRPSQRGHRCKLYLVAEFYLVDRGQDNLGCRESRVITGLRAPSEGLRSDANSHWPRYGSITPTEGTHLVDGGGKHDDDDVYWH